jgi:hypothetical protein
MPVRRIASIKAERENAKEKVCLGMFSPSECKLAWRLHRTIGMS